MGLLCNFAAAQSSEERLDWGMIAAMSWGSPATLTSPADPGVARLLTPDQLYADRLKSRLLRLDGWRVHFFKWLISLTIHFAMDIYWMVISTKAQLVRPPCALTLFVVFNVFTFLELFARLFACKYFHCACINLECRMRRFFGYGLSFGASLSMFIKLYK